MDMSDHTVFVNNIVFLILSFVVHNKSGLASQPCIHSRAHCIRHLCNPAVFIPHLFTCIDLEKAIKHVHAVNSLVVSPCVNMQAPAPVSGGRLASSAKHLCTALQWHGSCTYHTVPFFLQWHTSLTQKTNECTRGSNTCIILRTA